MTETFLAKDSFTPRTAELFAKESESFSTSIASRHWLTIFIARFKNLFVTDRSSKFQNKPRRLDEQNSEQTERMILQISTAINQNKSLS